ncbi:hypothetical protein J7I43_02230 [Chitinophaga sp. MAH-28]|uniref:DUF1016 family protein n=2 Tax=Chitinophagaceae TaxID=563835 RepID=A0ABS3Y8K3_9BACT|nr:hypothetical protein [Chitinophaga chungangae]
MLEQISDDLQRRLPGLRGFSVQNLRKMRLFYQSYIDLQIILIGSTVLSQLTGISYFTPAPITISSGAIVFPFTTSCMKLSILSNSRNI